MAKGFGDQQKEKEALKQNDSSRIAESDKPRSHFGTTGIDRLRVATKRLQADGQGYGALHNLLWPIEPCILK